MTNVALYYSRLGRSLQAHDRSTLAAVAEAIAHVKDCRFAGVHDSRQVSDRPFFVPDDTLMVDEASDLGIVGPNDLFGGVVPFPFVKTKAVTHPLIDVDPVRPVGWAPLFADAVRDVVLPGFTVFSIRDARIAAMRLLSRGAIRLKPALASGGEEQVLVATSDELEPQLDQLIPNLDLAARPRQSNLRFCRHVTTTSDASADVLTLRMLVIGWPPNCGDRAVPQRAIASGETDASVHDACLRSSDS